MKTLLYIFVLSLLAISASSDNTTVMFFNACNYFVEGDDGGKPKAEFSKKALADTIGKAGPDIIVLAEIGSENALSELLGRLNSSGGGYKFSRICRGYDESRHLAIISRFAPQFFEEKNDLTYSIRPKDREDSPPHTRHAERGFIHAVFKFQPGYSLHIVGAHLKSRLPNPIYNQTDMRRYEARLLKYFVNELQEKESGANILVLGDMNDTFDSDPMVTLRIGGKPEKRLYDLRPADARDAVWTHWWNQQDSYGRIDYAFANFALLPEVRLEDCRIQHINELWMLASDHRPLFIAIETKDASPPDEDAMGKMFKDQIYRGKK